MNEHDEAFWRVYIATTPEEDKNFGRPGRLLVPLIPGGLATGIALSWLARWLS